MTFRLTTFGSCRLEDDAGMAIRVPTLAFVMLAYLYETGQPVLRRDLARILWPTGHEAVATNLRSLLRRFTEAMPEHGEQILRLDNRYVTLDRQLLHCDLDVLELPDSFERLSALSGAVSKRFLAAQSTDHSPLDRWVRDVRSRVAATLRATFFAFQRPPYLSEGRTELKRAAVLLLEEDRHDEEVRQTFLAEDGQLDDLFAGRTRRRAEPPARIAAVTPREDLLTETLPRVALLPPEGLTDAQKGRSIANALIQDLTIGLCASRSVSVVAPYTSEKIRAAKDRSSLLQQYNVIYALDTKKTDDWLFAQLIFMPKDEVVWATRFKLDPGGATRQRQLIAKAIHQSVVDKIKSNALSAGGFDAHPEAYFAYLRGLQSLSSLTLPSVRRARNHFKEALNHQKGFAPGLAGISRTLSMEWVLTARGDDELLAEAERLANVAIKEDGSYAGAFKELGVSQLYRRKIDESLYALGEAEKLSPHYADVLCSHADSLTHGSNPKAALEKITSAISLNPLSPDTYFWTAAGACYFLEDYRQAIENIEKMRDKNPAARLAAACWGMLGETAKARACRNRVLRDNPNFDRERWLAMIPHKEEWQTELYREGLMKAGF